MLTDVPTSLILYCNTTIIASYVLLQHIKPLHCHIITLISIWMYNAAWICTMAKPPVCLFGISALSRDERKVLQMGQKWKKVKVNQLEKKSKSKSIVKRCRWISGAWPEGKRFQNAPQGIPNPHMGTHPQISWVSHCPNTSRVGWKILKMVTHLYLLYSQSTHGHPSANLPL